ncbi:hypothetical protein AAG570_009171 [Ranatra chinensis]|uniref:Uncharacterized protein n=1 Tax=Ranatra chinensis TaxID=642074 RepID=A0ABD0YT30_9HEMI
MNVQVALLVVLLAAAEGALESPINLGVSFPTGSALLGGSSGAQIGSTAGVVQSGVAVLNQITGAKKDIAANVANLASSLVNQGNLINDRLSDLASSVGGLIGQLQGLPDNFSAVLSAATGKVDLTNVLPSEVTNLMNMASQIGGSVGDTSGILNVITSLLNNGGAGGSSALVTGIVDGLSSLTKPGGLVSSVQGGSTSSGGLLGGASGGGSALTDLLGRLSSGISGGSSGGTSSVSTSSNLGGSGGSLSIGLGSGGVGGSGSSGLLGSIMKAGLDVAGVGGDLLKAKVNTEAALASQGLDMTNTAAQLAASMGAAGSNAITSVGKEALAQGTNMASLSLDGATALADQALGMVNTVGQALPAPISGLIKAGTTLGSGLLGAATAGGKAGLSAANSLGGTGMDAANQATKTSTDFLSTMAGTGTTAGKVAIGTFAGAIGGILDRILRDTP